jgi:hypothetical protein
LLGVDLDWAYLLQAGWHNDVLPLLYWHLNTTCPERVPPSILRELREFFCQTSVRNLAMTHELVRLLGLFRRHNIQALPFKGPSLALSLYGNVALRPVGDLDILVAKQDFRTVKQLLVDEGYRLDIEMNAEEAARRLEEDFFLGFRRPHGDIRIEIHWELLHTRLRGRAAIGSVWNSVTRSELAGQPTLALPAKELLLLLCIHGQRHDWERLKWIGDVGRLIETNPHIDWADVRRNAANMEQERAILMGTFLVSSLLGVQLPEAILRILRDAPSLAAQAGLICGRLFRPNRDLPGFREWLAYVEAVSGSSGEVSGGLQPQRRLQYLSAVIAPNYWGRFDLLVPRWLTFLHYVHRPMQLVRRHGVALFDRLR